MIDDYREQFLDAIRAAGLAPPDTIEPGRFHRFPGNGKHNGNLAGWCKLFDDRCGGIFGDFSTGLSESWRAQRSQSPTPAEREAFRRNVKEGKAQAEAKRHAEHAQAARIASTRWNAASSANPRHPYLVAKGVKAHGIRQDHEHLIISMRDASSALHSLQFIPPDGKDKRFLIGGRVTGCYFSIGKMGAALCVTEGFATGASIHEATGYAVAVAFSKGNLEAVALALRAKLPDVRIVVCADDDYRTNGNPGIAKATEAALAVGGLLAVPDFGADRPDGAKDFNDLARYRGGEAVKSAIATAKAPEIVEDQPDGANSARGDSDAWPEPQPLTAEEDSPPYPLDALPVQIGEAVAELVGFVLCPVAIVACSALSALSLSGQALANVRRADRLNGPISLYLLAIAESGERKTTCDDFILPPLREWEAEQAKAKEPDVAKYAAAAGAWDERRSGIKARIRDAARKGEPSSDSEVELAAVEAARPKALRVPRLIHTDATPEALAWSLASGWPSGGVMSSEAGIVFGGHGMGRDSVMRNLSLLNALWDGTSHRVDRRTSESFTLAGVRLTMGLAAQPETVRQFVEGTKGLARGSGFAARFLIAAPASTQGTRLFKDAPAWRSLPVFAARLRELLALPVKFDEMGAFTPPLLAMADDAHAHWVRFHDDVERELRPGGDMAEVRDVASKAADNVARLAALFHLYANGPVGKIGASAVAAAAQIVGWHLYQARMFLGEVAAPRESSNARRLDAWLIDRCRIGGVQEIERRTAQNVGPNPTRSGPALDAALAELAEAHRARLVERGKRKLIAVNPTLIGSNDGPS